MLYFSKLRIFTVLIFTVIFSYFALSNFTNFDDDFFKQKINLGLDLKGGSYLLLEIDNTPVIEQKLQNKVFELKKLSSNLVKLDIEKYENIIVKIKTKRIFNLEKYNT